MAHDPVAGREQAKRILDAFLGSDRPELLVIYGRRRVGQTHLIREYCAPRSEVFFCVTGQKGASRATQLFHFRNELSRTFHGGAPLLQPHNWDDALDVLASTLEQAGCAGVYCGVAAARAVAAPESQALPRPEHCEVELDRIEGFGAYRRYAAMRVVRMNAPPP